MASSGPIGRTPYFFSARRPFREERLAAYIRREHRHGRHLGEILDDPYVARCGSPGFVWPTIHHTSLIGLLGDDIREAIVLAGKSVSGK